MKTIKLISLLMIAIFAMSCNESRVYEKHRKNFTDYRWESSKILEYSPEITETDQKYKIYFAFRHIDGFNIESISINLEIITPSGETSNKDYVIQIFKDQFMYNGKCMGSYCDLETLIEDNYTFAEEGEYSFKVKHLMSQDPLLNVMEVGIIIDKVVEE